MKNTLKYFLLTFLLVVVGFFIKDHFYELTFAQIHEQNIVLQSSTLSSQFFIHILFSLAIGSIPVFYLLVDKFAKLKNGKQSLSTMGIIVGVGILSWQFRIFQINFQLEKCSKLSIGNNIQNSIDYSKLHFGLYLLIGFFIGAVLSTLFFRVKNELKST